MHFTFPHKTSAAHATAKIKTMLMQHAGEISKHAEITKKEWEGNTLTFAVKLQGKTITGTLVADDKNYTIDAQLPLLWRMFEGKIQKEIEKQAQGML